MCLEDDTHADTCAVGAGFYVIEYLDRYCMVNAFLGSYGSKKVPLVNGAYAYDAPDGMSYLICINQALYFGKEDVALLSTWQARANGVIVDNCPRQFDESSRFSVTFPKTEDMAEISIPFTIRGTNCCLSLRTPTADEVDTLPRLQLTSPDVLWDPSSDHFESAEPAESYDRVPDMHESRDMFALISDPALAEVNSALDEAGFVRDVEETVIVSKTIWRIDP